MSRGYASECKSPFIIKFSFCSFSRAVGSVYFVTTGFNPLHKVEATPLNASLPSLLNSTCSLSRAIGSVYFVTTGFNPLHKVEATPLNASLQFAFAGFLLPELNL
jgi:hypothetical protein